MFIFYNPNPDKRKVGDCTIRALSKALDTTWEQAYILAASKGYELGDMPSANSVWGAVLRDRGFYRAAIPNYCPDCYTVADFCEDNPIGTFVLGTGTHAVAVKDGDYFDAWDSGKEIPQYIFYKIGG